MESVLGVSEDPEEGDVEVGGAEVELLETVRGNGVRRGRVGTECEEVFGVVREGERHANRLVRIAEASRKECEDSLETRPATKKKSESCSVGTALVNGRRSSAMIS